MKKEICQSLLSILLIAFVLSETCYGQNWDRIKNATCTEGNGWYSLVPICVTNDGGCIIPVHRNINEAPFSPADRYDKNGNLLWDHKYLYNGAANDSIYIFSHIQFMLQLPDDNFVVLHNVLGAFSIVNNEGEVLKRAYHPYPEDSFHSMIHYLDMYYNADNNTVECVGLLGKGDSVFFYKTVYDTDMNNISRITRFLHEEEFLNEDNFLPATIFKSKNEFVFSRLVPGNGMRIFKCTNNGTTVYSHLYFDWDIIPLLDKRLIADQFGIDTMFVTHWLHDYHAATIALNADGELTFCNKVVSHGSSSPVSTVSSFLMVNLDSAGAIKSKKTIVKRVLTQEHQGEYHLGSPTLWFINKDSLLLFSLNDGIYGVSNLYNYLTGTGVTLYDKSANAVVYESIRSHIPVNECFLRNSVYAMQEFVATKNNKHAYAYSYYTDSLRGNLVMGLTKINNSGFYNIVKGNVFGDLNNNCLKNVNETGLPNFTVSATNGVDNSYGTSGRNGNYLINLDDSGVYTVRIRPNPSYPMWTPACEETQIVSALDSITIIDSIDFSLRPLLSCPSNTVDISTSPPFRLGRPNTYNVSYCNNGTVASTNTYITIKLDSVLVLNSATVPYTSLPGNTFRFDIGTLDYLTCGSFSFVATPDPTKAVIFQTICAEAHIYPDTICTTPNYLGAFITSGVQCLGDSVQFQLKNTGKGNMAAAQQYRVIENDTLILEQNFQLNTNQTFTKTIDAKPGKTYRIIAEQPANLPAQYGDKFTTAALENCERQSSFSTGFFTQSPVHPGTPYLDMTCNEIIGAYDPNDKVATPKGYSTPHYIEANTSIEYQINFQNTGNDTAFKVVLIDTISSKLDINSIQPGASSHTYQFERTDSNVIQFTFDNILLPDSNINEPASHGFVKFKIQQKANNPDGTKIYNKADIYFDYNSPITTNETYHTIGRDFIEVNLITQVINPHYNIKTVNVFPNPFRDKTQIILEGEQLKNPVLQLMNIEGQLIRTIQASGINIFEVSREDLSSGIYLFKVLQQGDRVANGKLVVQ